MNWKHKSLVYPKIVGSHMNSNNHEQNRKTHDQRVKHSLL